MRRIHVGVLGAEAVAHSEPNWRDYVPAGWDAVVLAATGGHEPREVQARALVGARLLASRRNLVVCSPTNSGKSAVGQLLMLHAIDRGKRAVLVEPLRALARQQAEGLRRLASDLPVSVFSVPPKVVIATGDYQLDHDLFSSPPDEAGELVVATPERLDSILRNPECAAWVDSVGALVADEVHLIRERRRGPTLERVIASFLSSAAPPRIALMSATIGNPEKLAAWVQPADVIDVQHRHPALEVELLDLEGAEEANTVLVAELASALEDTSNAALVFAYTRKDTEALAKLLGKELSLPVEALHSGMTTAVRAAIQKRVESGNTRCVVATTSLEMGLNLPVTHVYVRDATFHRVGPLGPGRLLQMLGRAGRGEVSGHGVVLLRPSDRHDREQLAQALGSGQVEPIESAFVTARGLRRGTPPDMVLPAAEFVIGELLRGGDEGRSDHDLATLAQNTLAGAALANQLGSAVSWLTHPCRLMAYRGEDHRLRATVLGSKAALSYMPLPHAAGFGRLVRDLLTLGSRGEDVLGRWTSTDHLLISQLVGVEDRSLRRFSKALADSVDGWMERNVSVRPVLFDWIQGEEEHSKASQLLGSLGVSESGRAWPKRSRQIAYLASYNTILMVERSRGASVSDLERRWKAASFAGAEERMRETAIWLVVGQGGLCELRAYYHHLLETCEADREQIKHVKWQLRRMRSQAFSLIEELKYCSALGPMVIGIRRMYKHHQGAVVGEGTLRRLEGAGVGSMAEVAQMSRADLVRLGVRSDLAGQIVQYCRRRMR